MPGTKSVPSKFWFRCEASLFVGGSGGNGYPVLHGVEWFASRGAALFPFNYEMSVSCTGAGGLSAISFLGPGTCARGPLLPRGNLPALPLPPSSPRGAGEMAGKTQSTARVTGRREGRGFRVKEAIPVFAKITFPARGRPPAKRKGNVQTLTTSRAPKFQCCGDAKVRGGSSGVAK